MSTLHPNIATLASIYEDLRRIEQHAHEDMVLHLAQRDHGSGPGRVDGKVAVIQQMLALLDQSRSTLSMSVDSIVANDYFGAALGSIRARRDRREIGMPFCGLWRFHDGRILEHWENAYDIAGLDAFMSGDARQASTWLRQ